MILLQIVMVSRGTRLEKNHESQSRTNTEPMSPQKSPKLKMLGPLCNQTVNLKTDSKTLYYSVLTETTRAKRIGIVKQQREYFYKYTCLMGCTVNGFLSIEKTVYCTTIKTP